jgi:hypothetical protein
LTGNRWLGRNAAQSSPNNVIYACAESDARSPDPIDPLGIDPATSRGLGQRKAAALFIMIVPQPGREKPTFQVYSQICD